MNKILAVFSLVALAVCNSFAISQGDKFTIDGITYEVSYTYFEPYQVKVKECAVVPEKLVIPATVTYDGRTFDVKSIYDGVFQDAANLKEVVLPEGIWSLGNCTFQGCTSLTIVNFPSTLRNVDMGTFQGCTALKEIHIPANVQNVYSNAFKECTGLVSVYCAAKSVSNDAFYGCSSLKYFIGEVGLESLSSLSYDRALEVIDFPSTFGGIDSRSLSGLNNLKSLVIRFESVSTETGFGNFDSHESLTIYVPADLVESYKASSTWASYAEQIKSIDELSTAVDAETLVPYQNKARKVVKDGQLLIEKNGILYDLNGVRQ